RRIGEPSTRLYRLLLYRRRCPSFFNVVRASVNEILAATKAPHPFPGGYRGVERNERVTIRAGGHPSRRRGAMLKPTVLLAAKQVQSSPTAGARIGPRTVPFSYEVLA